MPDISKISDVEVLSIEEVDGIVKTSIAKVGGLDLVSGPIDTHVFLLAGQSNMVGRAVFDNGAGYPSGTLQYPKNTGANSGYTDTTTIAAVPQLLHWDPDPADMGLAIDFATNYIASNANTRIVFIPAADGGTGFVSNNWNPGNLQYEHAVDATNALMAANTDWIFKGILWHQGERDQNNSNFANQFYLMIQSMREDITVADQETPFILGELVPGGNNTTPLNTGVLSDTPTFNYRTALVSAAGLTAFDGLHFDAASLRTFGFRYKDRYTKLNNPYPTAEVGAAGHWIFGNSNQLYIDLTGSATNLSRLGTPASSVAAAYNYKTGDTEIPGPNTVVVGGQSTVQARGLISGIADTADMTMCMVVKYVADGTSEILNGNLGLPSNTTGGHSWFISPANDLRFNERGGVGARTVVPAADLVSGAYYFIASSLNASDAYTLICAEQTAPGGLGFTQQGTGSGRQVAATRDMGVGNAHYLSTSFGGTTTVAEMIFFNSVKTSTELYSIADRSRARMAQRGITVR